VINSQESVITNEGGEKDRALGDKMSVDKEYPIEEKGKEDVPERRRSERLKSEIHLTTKEKNEA
jgi:hypothetical protein